jgi:hypothetical protein
MRRTIIVLAMAVLLTLSMVSAAFAGNGKDFKDCFGVSYGQSGLNYGQLKKADLGDHPALSPYGLPGVLAAHGPDGLAPLCGGD